MDNDQTPSYTHSPRSPLIPTPILMNTARNLNNYDFSHPEKEAFNDLDVTPWRQAYNMPPIENDYDLMDKFMENGQQSLFDDMNLAMILQNPIVNPIPQTPKMEKKLSFDDDDQPIKKMNQQGKAKQDEPSTAGKSIESSSVKRQPKTKFIDYQLLAKTAMKKNYQNLFKQEQKKKSKQEKGLKMLSQRAHEIVLQMKSVTYKQVAIKLYQELLPEKQLAVSVKSSISQEKEEKNIKRRVYDALNVLIALGILNKQGKKIVENKDKSINIKHTNSYSHKDAMQHHGKTFQSYYKLKKVLEQKRVNVQIAKKSYKNIEQLVNRNKNLNMSKEQIIPFPMIGIQVPKINQDNINLTNNEFHLDITSKFGNKLGDLDIVNCLELSVQSKKKQVKKYKR